MNVNSKVNTYVYTYRSSLLFTGRISVVANGEKIVILISKLYSAFTLDIHVV